MRRVLAGFVALAALLGTLGPHVSASPNEVSYDIRVRLDVAQQRVVGTQRVTLKNNTGEALPVLFFNLPPNAFSRHADTAYQRDLKRFLNATLGAVFSNNSDDASLSVQSVTVQGEQLQFFVQDTLLQLTLPQPLEPERSITLQIAFVNDLIEAAPGNVFAGSYAVRSGVREGVYTVAKWYPQLAVFDKRGWQLHPYRLMGEFYADFGDYTVRLTVPQAFVVGATGEQTNEQDHPDGSKTLTFRARKVHDVAWVTSERFSVSESVVAGKTLRTLWLNNSTLSDLVADSFGYYSDAFGDYAYDTLTAVQVTVGGGMEYPGIVMIARGSVEEVSHEVAHQWWYAAVGNDEFDETWLDEGPTTFASERYRIEARGESSDLRRMVSFREPGIPVLTAASGFVSLRTFGEAIYTKGSGVLWMLRGLLGSETFDRALRTYYERFRYKNATTQDLIDTFETVSGQDLGWFFDQWLRTSQVLDVALDAVEVRTRPDGSTVTRFTVVNEGSAHMPVDVVAFAGDQVLRRWVWDGVGTSTTFSLNSIQRPTRILLDPAHRLLEADRQDDVWERSPTEALGSLGAWLGIWLVVALASKRWRLTNVGRAG